MWGRSMVESRTRSSTPYSLGSCSVRAIPKENTFGYYKAKGRMINTASRRRQGGITC